MELKFEVKHYVLFEEFYDKRDKKFMFKSTAKKMYNEILKTKPNNEWIVLYKFYDTEIERLYDCKSDILDYKNYNGILSLPDCYFLHHFGENGLKINKSEFVLGDVNEFPFFISKVVDQGAPSQLIFPKEAN